MGLISSIYIPSPFVLCFHFFFFVFVLFLHKPVEKESPLLRRGARLALLVGALVQHDLVRILRRVERVPFAPVVADGVGEDGAVAVEGGRGDGAADGRVALEARVGVLVPEVEGPVGAGGAEGAVDGVEGDGVDGVHLDLVVRGRLAVAAEGEVGAAVVNITSPVRNISKVSVDGVPCVLLVDVVEGAAPLDARDGEAGRVEDAADDARLLLEGALDGLPEGGRVVEVDDVDVPLGGADDEQFVAQVHGVDALLAVERGDGRRLPEIPVAHRLVPRARRDHGGVGVGRLEKAHRADGRVVRGHLLRRGAVGREIQDARRLVRGGADDLLSILETRVSLLCCTGVVVLERCGVSGAAGRVDSTKRGLQMTNSPWTSSSSAPGRQTASAPCPRRPPSARHRRCAPCCPTTRRPGSCRPTTTPGPRRCRRARWRARRPWTARPASPTSCVVFSTRLRCSDSMYISRYVRRDTKRFRFHFFLPTPSWAKLRPAAGRNTHAHHSARAPACTSRSRPRALSTLRSCVP